MSNPSNTDDVIDSRDVIARIEELEAEREELASVIAEDDEARATQTQFHWLSAQARDHAEANLRRWDESDEAQELAALRKLASEAEESPDWTHGETLIRESYFTDYIRELIHDCYELPKEFGSSEWPWRHVTFDYEAAANEAKVDYLEVDFDGVTYLIRA